MKPSLDKSKTMQLSGTSKMKNQDSVKKKKSMEISPYKTVKAVKRKISIGEQSNQGDLMF